MRQKVIVLGLGTRLNLLAIGSIALAACAATETNSSRRGGSGGSVPSSGGSGGGSNTGGGNTGGSNTGGSATGGSGGTHSGGSSSGTGGLGSPGVACAGLDLEENLTVATSNVDRLTWLDAECEERSAALTRAGAGYLRQLTYQVEGSPRVCTGTGANGWNGFGYVVSHYSNTAATSKNVSGGSFGPLFVGRHHAVYEYRFTLSIGGQDVPMTVHWMFATGRDHPVYAVTYDASGTAAGSLVADTRTPYGDMMWEGDGQTTPAVAGVGWGDRYKFITTTAPLTMDSAWDYTVANTVPYVLEWATTPDAEMGLVQTQTYLQHDAGGYWFYGNWGKTSANQSKNEGQIGNMPVTWNWTYQLNQYELCIENPGCLHQTTQSHRLAWGGNYGAVGGAQTGSANYAAYGDDRQVVGHPYQSYSVFVVLDRHSESPVFDQVTRVEAAQDVALTATQGTVATQAPGGVGRTDPVTLTPKGYDARYAVWRIAAEAGAVAFDVTVGSEPVRNPVVVVTGFTNPTPTVKVNGTAMTADLDYLASEPNDDDELWITFRPGWSGSTSIEIE